MGARSEATAYMYKATPMPIRFYWTITGPFPALSTLAGKGRCGRESIQRYISDPEKASIITRKPLRRSITGVFLQNVYGIYYDHGRN
jgi:hypothetical protein